MKRSFVRIMSGLLAAAMIFAMPLAAKADDGVMALEAAPAGATTVNIEGISVKLRCNHTIGAADSSMEKTSYSETATCTKGGFQEYKCKYCGQLDYTYTPFTGHDYSVKKTYAESGEGSNDYYLACSHSGCNAEYLVTAYDGTVMHSHVAGNTSIPDQDGLQKDTHTPNHGVNGYGYTVVTCTRTGNDGKGCTYVQYTDYVAPTKHEYGEWKWEKRATENSYGYAYHDCTTPGCTARERIMTYALSVATKVGRVKNDGIFAYDKAYQGNAILYVAKGTKFTVANEITDGRYHATTLTAPNDSTKTGDFYIDAKDVDVIRQDNTDTVKTGNPNVQMYIQVKTDATVDVYSGTNTTSAPIETIPGGTVKYVYLVDDSQYKQKWGRISATENKWIQLSGNGKDQKFLYALDAFGFGGPVDALENVTLGKKLDTGTVTAASLPVYNSMSTSAATVGTVKKDAKIDFYYRVVNGVQENPFVVKDGIAWGYIAFNASTNNQNLHLSTSGYINLAEIKLASTTNPTPKPTTPTTTGGVVATGTVTSAINLNVRKNPEVSVLNLMGSLPTGTKLEFYEVQNGWGRIKYNGNDGWVCMTYVKLNASSSTGSGSTVVADNGTIANCSSGVNIRDVKDAHGLLLGTIPVNSRVAITKLEDGWGYVNGRGWVFMQYVRLDAGAEEAIRNPKKNDTTTKDDTASGTIKTYTTVKALGKVKGDVGVFAKAVENQDQKLLTLVNGNTFVITDRTIVNNVTWYKTTIGSITGWVKSTGTDGKNAVDLPALSGKVSAGTLNVYVSASLDSAVSTTLIQNVAVTIEENSQTTDGVYVWGRLKGYNGYVQMNNLTLDVPASNVITGSSVGTKNITGVTNADNVPVYSVANDTSKVIMKLSKNRMLSISAWYNDNGVVRGKFTDGDLTGWIDMRYLDQDALTAKVTVDVVNFYNNTTTGQPGSVISNLNLRQGASTTVIERVLKDGVAWGRISARDKDGLPNYYWINLAGTDLGSYSLTPGEAKNDNSNSSNNNNNSTSGSTTGSNTASTAVKGVICNTEEVNVRTGAGVSNALATTLKKGTPVTVYEQKTVDNALWGRIDQGWVALSYVDLSAKSNTTTSTVTGGTLSGNTILTSVPSGAIAVGFVNTDSLKVRAGTGFGYAVQTTLPKYTNVVVYEQVLTDGVLWVRCDQGWMVGTYLTYTGLSVTGSGTAGTVARCFYTARVRANPGVNSALVGYVMVNSRLEIYEQQSYSNEMWGRTSIGWINMNYVLTGDIPTA